MGRRSTIHRFVSLNPDCGTHLLNDDMVANIFNAICPALVFVRVYIEMLSVTCRKGTG